MKSKYMLFSVAATAFAVCLLTPQKASASIKVTVVPRTQAAGDGIYGVVDLALQEAKAGIVLVGKDAVKIAGKIFAQIDTTTQMVIVTGEDIYALIKDHLGEAKSNSSGYVIKSSRLTQDFRQQVSPLSPFSFSGKGPMGDFFSKIVHGAIKVVAAPFCAVYGVVGGDTLCKNN